MSLLRYFPWTGCAAAFLTFCVASAGVSATEPGEASEREYGRITANDVYVRSGASLNHYPVYKLNAGDRVTILGTHGEWLEIEPPEGTFSWISAQFVDSVDDRDGVVNGDNVRVRAGSLLPKWAKSKYAVQTMLDKGAEVSIVGTNPDGFLRIVPPADATLWVHGQFVEPVSEADALSAQSGSDLDSASAIAAESVESAEQGVHVAGEAVATAGGSSPFQAMPMTAQRRQLVEIDAQAKAEVDKPLLERRFAPLIARYKKVIEQEEDDFAARYAQTRLTQLTHLDEMIEAVRRTRELREETDTRRRALLEERLKMQTVTIPAPRGLDVKGLFQTSALYPEGAHLQRYRLMDPTAGGDRTVAYVELPPDSDLNPAEFLGRFVGVRAVRQRFQEGGLDTIPVYVAGEIVILDLPEESERPRQLKEPAGAPED